MGGGERGIGGTVYGTILALAVIAGGAGSRLSPWKLALAVEATASAIWVAHVYSHGLGESIERGRRLTRDELTSIGRRELPILAAAAPPVAVLMLGAIGVVKESSAIWIAFVVGLMALAVQGARYARVERLGFFASAAIVAANLALGALVVALKVAVSH
jgi:hypothetical protein